MTIAVLSAEEFSAAEIPFSNPALQQQFADRLPGTDDARLESLVLIHRDEQTPEPCRGGMIVPVTRGKIITAIWPVAETREVEDRLLEAYASAVAGMSPPRTATLLSEAGLGSGPHANCGPFVPLTEIVRYRLKQSHMPAAQDRERHLRYESHSPDEESAIELLRATEVSSLDLPEFLPLMNWRERLHEYQITSPQSRLLITSVADRGIPLGVAVWSVDQALRESEVHYLGVLPSQRGRGWGGKLLQRVCAECRQRGAQSAGLNVDARNHFAVKLYESAGFREVFRRRLWIFRDKRLFSTGSTHGFREPPVF